MRAKSVRGVYRAAIVIWTAQGWLGHESIAPVKHQNGTRVSISVLARPIAVYSTRVLGRDVSVSPRLETYHFQARV